MSKISESIQALISVVLGFLLAGVMLGVTFVGWVLSTLFGIVVLIASVAFFLIFGVWEVLFSKKDKKDDSDPTAPSDF